MLAKRKKFDILSLIPKRRYKPSDEQPVQDILLPDVQVASDSEEIQEPPQQVGRVKMLPDGPIKNDADLKSTIRALLKNHRKDYIITELVSQMSWDALLLCMSNYCTSKAIEYRQAHRARKDEEWLEKAYYFHNVISKSAL